MEIKLVPVGWVVLVEFPVGGLAFEQYGNDNSVNCNGLAENNTKNNKWLLQVKSNQINLIYFPCMMIFSAASMQGQSNF